jgi:RNA polymerase sigma-70 factor (ECF subfamily)
METVTPAPTPLSPAPLPAVARFPQDRLSDARLVEGAAAGDRDAIAAVWDRYSSMVRSVLRSALGPDHAVEDLVQEVFLGFLVSAKSVTNGAALRSYLISIATRQAALEIRRRKVRRWVTLSVSGELPERPHAPEDMEGRSVLRAFYRVLDRLSSRRRLAFVLRHVEGLELLETALALGVSESTARRELDKATRQLHALAQREPALSEHLARLGRVRA